MERVNWALALKAEVVLAWQLTTRHRAPRIAMLISLMLVGLLVVERASATGPGREESILVMAGLLSSVASSRLLSRGAALASVRRIAVPGWVPVTGRLCGMLLFVVFPVSAAASILVPTRATAELAHQSAILVTYMGAIGSWVMALTPLLGASGAAGVGLTVSLVGRLTPADLLPVVAHLRVTARLVDSAWNALPLAWQASQSLQSHATDAVFIFASWTAVGLAIATWISSRASSTIPRLRNP